MAESHFGVGFDERSEEREAELAEDLKDERFHVEKSGDIRCRRADGFLVTLFERVEGCVAGANTPNEGCDGVYHPGGDDRLGTESGFEKALITRQFCHQSNDHGSHSGTE